jgi:hypothetical protein
MGAALPSAKTVRQVHPNRWTLSPDGPGRLVGPQPETHKAPRTIGGYPFAEERTKHEHRSRKNRSNQTRGASAVVLGFGSRTHQKISRARRSRLRRDMKAGSRRHPQPMEHMTLILSDTERPSWRHATGADLDVINRIADAIHVDLPERPEVFAEKLRGHNCKVYCSIRKHCPKNLINLQSFAMVFGIAEQWTKLLKKREKLAFCGSNEFLENNVAQLPCIQGLITFCG